MKKKYMQEEIELYRELGAILLESEKEINSKAAEFAEIIIGKSKTYNEAMSLLKEVGWCRAGTQRFIFDRVEMIITTRAMHNKIKGKGIEES